MNSKSKNRLLVSLTSLGIVCFATHAWMKHRTSTSEIIQQSAAIQHKLSEAELDQLTAPIALYPDRLLSQILMAATWPAQVIQAVQWSHDNPGIKGDDAIRAVTDQPWDASVKSLVAFPDLLVSVGSNPAWIQNLGLAFINQPEDVLASVQRLRNIAYKEGKLRSTPQQTVGVKGLSTRQPLLSSDASTFSTSSTFSTITIESVSPQTVYIPQYDPREIYVNWDTPDYPPVYFPPADVNGNDADLGNDTDHDEDNGGGNKHRRGILAFSLGVVTAYALYSYIHWPDHHHDHDHKGNIDIDANKVNFINGNASIASGSKIVEWQPDTTRMIGAGLTGGISAAGRTSDKPHTAILPQQGNATRQSVVEKLQQSSASDTAGSGHLRQQIIQQLQSSPQEAAEVGSIPQQNADTRQLHLPQQQPDIAVSQSSVKSLKEDVKSAHQAELQREQVEKLKQAAEARQQADQQQQAETVRQQAEQLRQEAEAQQQADQQQQAEAARQQAEQLKQAAEARQQAEQQEKEEAARQQAEQQKQEEKARRQAEQQQKEEAARQQAEQQKQEEEARHQAEQQQKEEAARQLAEKLKQAAEARR